MKKKLIVGLTIYVVLIGICVFFVYAIPSIRGLLVETYITQQGEIINSDEVEAYIVRDESVYKAPAAGSLERLAKPNNLYKAGTKIVKFTNEDGKEITKRSFSTGAGYIVYSSDGLEKKLQASNIDNIKKTAYEKSHSAKGESCAKSGLSRGDAMFKVVKNGKWYLTFFVEPKQAKKYIVGNTVHININDEKLKASVYSVTKGKQYSRVILKCGTAFKDYLIERKVSAEIIVASAEGLVLEDKSIVEKDGKQGVLVKNKMGVYVFKPICIKADDGEKCVVYQDVYTDEKLNFVNTVGIYDEIIAKPSAKDVENSR